MPMILFVDESYFTDLKWTTHDLYVYLRPQHNTEVLHRKKLSIRAFKRLHKPWRTKITTLEKIDMSVQRVVATFIYTNIISEKRTTWR